jgi:hypothetical protein
MLDDSSLATLTPFFEAKAIGPEENLLELGTDPPADAA